MSRIQGSATTDAQSRQAIAQFERHSGPPGTLLAWVCWDNTEYLNLAQDPLLLSPA
jgi:hypothetical protein